MIQKKFSFLIKIESQKMQITEVYLELYQISMVEFFTKILNAFWSLIVFAKKLGHRYFTKF